MSTTARAFDFLGIGFGPANLAIAVAMEGRAARNGDAYAFIEKKPEFIWHAGMLLDGSLMQISFLKDLATLRDPTNRFTFINYLHRAGRLEEFINLRTFFPTRLEYTGYLRWVAGHFDDRCHYGEEVFAVEPLMQEGTVRWLRVRSRTGHGDVRERVCRNLVIGVGGVPHIPQVFGKPEDPRLFHSAAYLDRIDTCLQDISAPRRVAVVGSGQSAAEVFCDLTRRFGDAEVSLIMRSKALKPADDSPFVNEIFTSSFTDVIYHHSPAQRRQLLQEFRNTNYAAVDPDLIERIYELLYLQKVTGVRRHEVLAAREVEHVIPRLEGIELVLHEPDTGRTQTKRFDAVVLATGYRRDGHEELLAGIAGYLDVFTVDRQYRLKTTKNFLPNIHLQGCCEESHGLSDTLLSVLAVRSREIVDAMLHCRSGTTPARAMPAELPRAATRG